MSDEQNPGPYDDLIGKDVLIQVGAAWVAVTLGGDKKPVPCMKEGQPIPMPLFMGRIVAANDKWLDVKTLDLTTNKHIVTTRIPIGLLGYVSTIEEGSPLSMPSGLIRPLLAGSECRSRSCSASGDSLSHAIATSSVGGSAARSSTRRGRGTACGGVFT